MEENAPFENAARQAIRDWNWHVNPKDNNRGVDFWFVPAVGENAEQCGDIRIIMIYDSAEEYAGETVNYYSHNIVPSNHDREYVVIRINMCYAPVNNFEEMRKIINHEIGHALGLAHNRDDNGTLMYPYYDRSTAYVPTRDDLNGIHAIYDSFLG